MKPQIDADGTVGEVEPRNYTDTQLKYQREKILKEVVRVAEDLHKRPHHMACVHGESMCRDDKDIAIYNQALADLISAVKQLDKEEK